MAKDVRNYVIKVTKAGPDYHTQLLEGGRPKTGDLEFDKNGDGLKKTAHYKLNFTIDDSGLNQAETVMFAPDNADVLAVHTNVDQCPPVGSHMPSTFWVDKNQGGQLRLINMDLTAQKLRFKINMVKVSDPAARPFIELDPIINNGNRGTSEPFVSYSYAPALTGTIVGLGTVAALTGNAFVPATGLVYAIGGAIVGLILSFLADRM